MGGTGRELCARDALVLVTNFRFEWMILARDNSGVVFGIKCV